jgi:hypothetical protein
MTYEIKNRWTGEVIYSHDGANLSGADLSGADLSRADLSGVDLSGADLSGANLSRANLSGADLSGANLSSANLSRADLSGADLSGVYLSGANLSGADLSGADLSGVDLSGVDLSGANLSRANLSAIRDDLWSVLDSAPAEAQAVRDALLTGKVDGSTYSGDCCCLVGTMANARGCYYRDMDGLRPDSSRAAERWFLAIRPGMTSETSQIVRITVAWVDEWLAKASTSVVMEGQPSN